MIRDLLAELQKRREEEDELRHLIEEMQRNLDEPLDRILWEYIEAFDKERGRPQLLMRKLWQMMQSKDTKNLNSDRYLDEILKQNETNRMERINQDNEVLSVRRRRRAIIVTVPDSSHRWKSYCSS